MPHASRTAAAIDLRVRQLDAQGITGIALADHMIGHMQDLHQIYNTASDQTLSDLCRRFPGFERYAMLMEEVSEQNQAMVVSGSHPCGDLPELPEPLKINLLHVMRAAVELEREFQSAVDASQSGQAKRLTTMRHRWADDLQKLVFEFQSSDLPLRTQAMVQQALKAMATRIEKMGKQ